MSQKTYSFVDLETTGPNADGHKIIEIALIQISEGKEIYRYQTFVNPNRSLPPIITEITGINESHLRDAPEFDDIALHLKDCLDGTIIVAHNVGFDYGFLKREFASSNMEINVNTACTVKLSRHFYPSQRKHNLDALIERHGFICSDRHRAMGDAEVLVQLVEHLEQQFGNKAVHEILNKFANQASIEDSRAHKTDLIPEKPGVYTLFGQSKYPLFISSAKNLKKAIKKEISKLDKVKKIEYEVSAGELGAIFKAGQKIKHDLPLQIANPNKKRKAEFLEQYMKEWDKEKVLLIFENADDYWSEYFAVYDWKIVAYGSGIDSYLNWSFVAFPEFEFRVFEYLIKNIYSAHVFSGSQSVNVVPTQPNVKFKWILRKDWEFLKKHAV